jgi:hypothetical protein
LIGLRRRTAISSISASREPKWYLIEETFVPALVVMSLRETASTPFSAKRTMADSIRLPRVPSARMRSLLSTVLLFKAGCCFFKHLFEK